MIQEKNIDILFPFLVNLTFIFTFHVLYEQDRRAERKHYHIVETDLTLLTQIIVFLINRLPTQILLGLSPLEKPYKRILDYHFLKLLIIVVFHAF